MLTQERLKNVIKYDEKTGIFIWINANNQTQLIGKEAGGLCSNGYISIGIDSKRYRAHRLAFLYMEGFFPSLVDHINGIKNDNRWNNLRKSNKKRNAQNIRKAHKDNISGFLGVEICGNKFTARIKCGEIRKTIGTFNTAEEAHAAYMKEKKELHEDCPK